MRDTACFDEKHACESSLLCILFAVVRRQQKPSLIFLILLAKLMSTAFTCLPLMYVIHSRFFTKFCTFYYAV